MVDLAETLNNDESYKLLKRKIHIIGKYDYIIQLPESLYKYGFSYTFKYSSYFNLSDVVRDGVGIIFKSGYSYNPPEDMEIIFMSVSQEELEDYVQKLVVVEELDK